MAALPDQVLQWLYSVLLNVSDDPGTREDDTALTLTPGLPRCAAHIQRQRGRPLGIPFSVAANRSLHVQQWPTRSAVTTLGNDSRQLSRHRLQIPRSHMDPSRLPCRPRRHHGIRRGWRDNGDPARTACQCRWKGLSPIPTRLVSESAAEHCRLFAHPPRCLCSRTTSCCETHEPASATPTPIACSTTASTTERTASSSSARRVGHLGTCSC